MRRANTSSSVLGKRCGSTRSVNVAIPTRNSSELLAKPQGGAAARGGSGSARPALSRASIERDVSTTTNTSASGRTSRSTSTRSAAARPRGRAARQLTAIAATVRIRETPRRAPAGDRTVRTRSRGGARGGARRAAATTPSASSEPSGVSSVTSTPPSSVAAAGLAGAGAARAAAARRGVSPGRASVGRIPAPRRRSTSRLNFASALPGSSSIACRKLATAFRSSSVRSGRAAAARALGVEGGRCRGRRAGSRPGERRSRMQGRGARPTRAARCVRAHDGEVADRTPSDR